MISAVCISDLTINNAGGLIDFEFTEQFHSPGSENPQMHPVQSEKLNELFRSNK